LAKGSASSGAKLIATLLIQNLTLWNLSSHCKGHDPSIAGEIIAAIRERNINCLNFFLDIGITPEAPEAWDDAQTGLALEVVTQPHLETFGGEQQVVGFVNNLRFCLERIRQGKEHSNRRLNGRLGSHKMKLESLDDGDGDDDDEEIYRAAVRKKRGGSAADISLIIPQVRKWSKVSHGSEYDSAVDNKDNPWAGRMRRSSSSIPPEEMEQWLSQGLKWILDL
jgi:hypothetical protein